MSTTAILNGGDVVIGTLTFKRNMLAASKSVIYDASGKPLHQDLVMVKYWKLLFCIESGFLRGRTIEETDRNFESLSPEEGDVLWAAYLQENGVREGESLASDSSSMSDKAQPTQRLDDSSSM